MATATATAALLRLGIGLTIGLGKRLQPGYSHQKALAPATESIALGEGFLVGTYGLVTKLRRWLRIARPSGFDTQPQPGPNPLGNGRAPLLIADGLWVGSQILRHQVCFAAILATLKGQRGGGGNQPDRTALDFLNLRYSTVWVCRCSDHARRFHLAHRFQVSQQRRLGDLPQRGPAFSREGSLGRAHSLAELRFLTQPLVKRLVADAHDLDRVAIPARFFERNHAAIDYFR
jgi:hypothetical protein